MYSYTKTVPDVIEHQPRRIVVIPDVHRDLQKAKACFALAGLLSAAGSWSGGDTVVVQVGDQVDGQPRMPRAKKREHVCGETLKEDMDVLRFFNDMHRMAEASGGAVYSLLGNHELMNVMGQLQYAETDACGTCEMSRRRAFAPGGEAARLLATTRAVCLRVGRVFFVHAGFLPWHIRAVGGKPQSLNTAMTEILLGNYVSEADARICWMVCMDQQGALTNRAYSPDMHISKDETARVLDMLQADHMVVGHNATPSGIVSLHGGLVYVCDPGMSRAILDAPPQVLEITSKSGERGLSFKLIRYT